MGIVFMATADQGDTKMWTVAENTTASTDQARTGSKSFKTRWYSWLSRAVPSRADYYARVAFRPLAGNGKLQIVFDEGAVRHITVEILVSTRTINVSRAGSLLGTVTLTPSMTDCWTCFEIYCKVHDSTGIVQVKANGALVLDLTGQDTQNGAAGAIDSIALFTPMDGADYNYFDDILIRDDAWPVLGGICLLVPTAAGANADWAASAGDAYACVDELPAAFTDYIYHDVSVVNAEHDFNFGNLAAGSFTIGGVGIYAVAQLDAAGAGNVRATAISDGTPASGPSTALTTSETIVNLYMAVDPHTSAAWEKAAVDALIAGVETI